MDAVKLPSAYGQLSYRMTYNPVSMFSDLAILGLVDLNEVTPELLSMRKNHVEILQRINTVLAGRTDEEKQADADRINPPLWQHHGGRNCRQKRETRRVIINTG